MATSILRSFTFRAEKANPALFRALGETTDASKSGRILRFPVVHQAAKTALAPKKRPLIPTRRTSARNQTLQHWRILLIGRGPFVSNWYSTRKRTRPFSFHAQREGRRAGVDSAACTATAEKRQRPDFDAPVFRLSALARVIRTQAAKKKGRKIDVDPAFPPEIRGASDADLASTSAESPPARKPCVHQFKKVG